MRSAAAATPTQIYAVDGVRLTEEKTSLALRQRGRLGEQVYGFAMSVAPTGDVYFDGRKVHPDAILCGSGREIDFVTPAQHDILALSDRLIAEVAKADIIVISTPMYNYGMPAQLKSWFDQVVRINKTFDFDLTRGDFPLQPLLSGKTLITITSSGEFGFEKGGIRESASHLQPHLRTLSKYLGVETIYEIAAEYQEFGDDRHRTSVSNALSLAETLAAELADTAAAASLQPEAANG